MKKEMDVFKGKEVHSDFIIFKTEDEKISVDVRFEEDTVWLTQEQMSLLFGKAKSTISGHIKTFLKRENWMKKWLFGISELPLRMVL